MVTVPCHNDPRGDQPAIRRTASQFVANVRICPIRDPGQNRAPLRNRIESNKEGHDVFEKINTATTKFLKLELESIGYIYEDSNVKKSVKKQVPFLIGFPNSLASRGVELIAENLIRNSTYTQPSGGFSTFIKKIFKSKQ